MDQIQKRNINPETKKAIELLSKKFEQAEMKQFLEELVISYSKIGDSSYYGGKHCGSDAEHAGAEYIYNTLTKLGIKAEMLPFQCTRFQFNDSSISYAGQSGEIKPYACLSVPTVPEGITGTLVNVGNGYQEFYENNDVKGKNRLN